MNKISGLSAALAASAGALAVAPAQAAPITLSHSVTLSTLLQQGQSANLSFDINAFLTAQGHSASEVVGGEVSVFGFSDASYAPGGVSADYNVQTVGAGSHLHTYSYRAYYSYSYTCGSWLNKRTCYGGGWYYAYATQNIPDYARYADRDIYQVDAVADQMRLTVGGTVLTDTADTRTQGAGNFGAYLYDGFEGCYTTECSRTSLYHRERNVYSAIGGELALTASLDPVALADLQGDGVLGLNIAAPVGQFGLRSVSFSLLLNEPMLLPVSAPLSGTTGGSVPEPAGVALTGVALAAALAAGGRRVRQRGRSAATTPPGAVADDDGDGDGVTALATRHGTPAGR
ncbi:hypothetical protein AACH10_23715 [Ideonella sp. DXS22W]|uniref:PEP-CTERM protein-sorting domain-containing protein n=1 Tax=Pseudaquabacterium inlustre TaxID=2984192 RepID=A0ABU9CRA2_9BURK